VIGMAMQETLNVVQSRNKSGDFCARVIERSGQPVSSCFQCQRCGGGCPVSSASETTPNEFFRLLTLGLEDEARKNRHLWLCVGCNTCGARCPNKISTNEVIDAFRAEVGARGPIAPEAKDIRTFHKLFLSQVKYLGRLHEVFLISALKMRTGKLFKDMALGMKMFKKGKIPLLPHKLAGMPAVRALFRRRRAGE